jgi:hypothetical protein
MSNCVLTLCCNSLVEPQQMCVNDKEGGHVLGSEYGTILTVNRHHGTMATIGAQQIRLQRSADGQWTVQNIGKKPSRLVKKAGDIISLTNDTPSTPIETGDILTIVIAWAKYHITLTDSPAKAHLPLPSDNFSDDHYDKCKKTLPKQQRAALEELVCSICQGPFNKCMVLHCEHSFCTSCLEKWFLTSGETKCPLCRCFQMQLPIRQPVVDAAINALLPKEVLERRKTHKRMVDGTEAVIADVTTRVITRYIDPNGTQLPPVWVASPENLEIYASLLTLMRGAARRVVTDRIQLTNSRIQKASEEELGTVITGMKLGHKKSALAMRIRLLFFIVYF